VPGQATKGLINLYTSVIDGLLRLGHAHIAGEIFLMDAQVGDGTGEAHRGARDQRRW
jgi:hypothetical protein